MNYIIEANIGIVFLYSMYVLLFRNETDFRRQRIFLLTASMCALLFPLIKISPPAVVQEMRVIVLPELTVVPAISSRAAEEILMAVYFSGAGIIAALLLFSAGRLYQTMKQSSGRYRDTFYVIESSESNDSWSFFKFIHIGRSGELSSEEKDLILKHEMLHGKLLHSADMVLVTLVCVVFWFNPAVWLYRRTMAKVHEFEVDSLMARQNGADGYSVLLLKTALSANGFLLAHHFNQSFILKRINMINTIKNKVDNWKLVALAFTVTIYFATVACTELDNNAERKTKLNTNPATDEVMVVVDESAIPVNGMTAFYEDLGNTLQYPEQARKMGIEGKVFVEFVVGTTGELSDFKVVKGIGAGCDAEVIRVMQLMKNWKPGKLNGDVVAQKMVLPITFKLG